jgi:hypothetical protein
MFEQLIAKRIGFAGDNMGARGAIFVDDGWKIF